MKFRIIQLLILVAVACTPIPSTTTDPGALSPDTAVTSPPVDDMSTNEPFVNPFLPKPGDASLTRGTIYISEVSLMIRESYPPQISLSVGGDLPTPCHELRAEIAAPDQENKIVVEAYSVADPNVACVQVLEPFQEYIDLGAFPGGHYSVWVNGELAGEFNS